MAISEARSGPPRVLVLADIPSNARNLVERILRPAGIEAWADPEEASAPDVIVVDVTQLRGDPLAGLRERRSAGEEAPAIVLAAHFPASRLRDLFRLGVADILIKPFRPNDLTQAIFELREARASEVGSQLLARRLQAAREQARRRTEELRLLTEIGRVVVQLRDLDQILARVAEAAAFVTGAEEANIYLAEPGTQEVVLRASKQAGEPRATLPRLRVTDTLAGQVYRTGQPVLRQPTLEGGSVKVQTGFLVQSLIKVPIRTRKGIVGVLGVYNRLAPRAFTEHHLTVLMALATWAGVAIEQAMGPEPAPPQADLGPPLAAPEAFVRGLAHVAESLQAWLRDQAHRLDDEARRRMAAALEELEELRRVRLAVLPEEETEGLVDLPEIIREVAESLRLPAAQRGLELVAERAPTLPMFRGDSTRVRRVVRALTEAALRRTRRGRVVLEVHRFEVRGNRSDGLPLPAGQTFRDGLWVAVRVSDTSQGLSPDTLRALQAPRPEPGQGEMGGGLSMGEVRMMVESLGGVLWHDQTPASTTITFALPIQ